MTQNDPTIGWRQLAVIDSDGQTAFFVATGSNRFTQKAEGKDCCAIGNIIRNEDVPKAMTDAFEADPNEPLAEQLLRALAARDAAGVEFRQIKSAALMVVHQESFTYVDLRVDLDRALLAQLHYQGELDKALLARYIERKFDPNSILYPEVEDPINVAAKRVIASSVSAMFPPTKRNIKLLTPRSANTARSSLVLSSLPVKRRRSPSTSTGSLGPEYQVEL